MPDAGGMAAETDGATTLELGDLGDRNQGETPPLLFSAAGEASTEEDRRWSLEAQETVGCPLVPVGRPAGEQVTHTKAESRIVYPAIGWQIVRPSSAEEERVPSSTVLDVYVGLNFLYANAGFPADGRIRFSRYEFMQLLGWLSKTTDDFGQPRLKPSGRHYKQLEDACTYLMQTIFVSESRHQLQLDLEGRPFRGTQGFPILQYVRLVDDVPGPRPKNGQRPHRSEVVFSEAFVRMLAQGRRGARFDLDLFLSLSRGTPRQLFRTFCFMRRAGMARISIEEVFQRVGSTQSHHVPARARQILDKAHEELEAHGVLTESPTYEKIDGTWRVCYAFGDPSALMTEEELLVAQAVDYGVTKSMAREVAVACREELIRVLAAVTLGMIRPRKSLPGMIVSYAREGYEIVDTGKRIGGPDGDQMTIGLETFETTYLRWAATERERRLDNRHDVNVERVAKEVARQRQARGADDPDWVLEGLTRVRLNQRLGVPGLRSYAERVAA